MQSETYRAGSIGTICASALSPVYVLLAKDRESMYSLETRLGASSIENASGKGTVRIPSRPCVMFGRNPVYPKVCLLVTMAGKERESLPWLFQHFLAPLYPNETPCAGNLTSAPFRATPDWDPPKHKVLGTPVPTWIIARQYTPRQKRRRVTKKWTADLSEPNGPTFCLGSSELERLRDLCMEQDRRWDNVPKAEKEMHAAAFLQHVAEKQQIRETEALERKLRASTSACAATIRIQRQNPGQAMAMETDLQSIAEEVDSAACETYQTLADRNMRKLAHPYDVPKRHQNAGNDHRKVKMKKRAGSVHTI